MHKRILNKQTLDKAIADYRADQTNETLTELIRHCKPILARVCNEHRIPRYTADELLGECLAVLGSWTLKYDAVKTPKFANWICFLARRHLISVAKHVQKATASAKRTISIDNIRNEKDEQMEFIIPSAPDLAALESKEVVAKMKEILQQHLTEREYEILLSYLQIENHIKYDEITDETGYHGKAIDNAMLRIKTKAYRIWRDFVAAGLFEWEDVPVTTKKVTPKRSQKYVAGYVKINRKKK